MRVSCRSVAGVKEKVLVKIDRMFSSGRRGGNI